MTGPHRIALAGCGNVGQALVRLIAEEHPAARGLEVAAVCDLRYGTVVSESGIDPRELLAALEDGTLSGLKGHVPGSGVLEALDACTAETLVELTFTDLETGEPALAHIRHALSAGMNVSTTNKGPIALHLDELERLAADHDVVLAYEGTVMSGSPALLTATALRDAGFEGAEGILNGTTNYIITRMEEGCSYADALAEAQDRGYAEADPRGDVDGHDVAGKLVILARVLAGADLAMSDVSTVPLSSLTPAEVSDALAAGDRWRYVAALERHQGGWAGTVAPRRLHNSHPLASITGATNAITFQTHLLGAVTIAGPGAGRDATAYAVLSDLRAIRKGT